MKKAIDLSVTEIEYIKNNFYKGLFLLKYFSAAAAADLNLLCCPFVFNG